MKIAIYGTGGHGREIAAYLQSGLANHRPEDFVGFIDDNPANAGSTLDGAAVFSLQDFAARQRDVKVVCGVGDPRLRERLAAKCTEHRVGFTTVVCAGTVTSPRVVVSAGCMIAPGTIMTTNIRLGNHVHVNVGCTISHDVEIGDFANINPGVHINGRVVIGARAYIGAGATIINGSPGKPLVVGDDAVVGMGACVIRPVASGTTVVGVPARSIRPDDGGAEI